MYAGLMYLSDLVPDITYLFFCSGHSRHSSSEPKGLYILLHGDVKNQDINQHLLVWQPNERLACKMMIHHYTIRMMLKTAEGIENAKVVLYSDVVQPTTLSVLRHPKQGGTHLLMRSQWFPSSRYLGWVMDIESGDWAVSRQSDTPVTL